jgi:hypothetical protein
MTWAEIKKQIEDAGVTDDMEMWYIDIAFDRKIWVEPKKQSGPTVIGFSVYN